MNKKRLQRKVDRLTEKVRKVKAKRDFAYDQLTVLESQEYIKERGITLDQVERPDLRMYLIEDFVARLSSAAERKPFAEWNGLIYKVEDLIDNHQFRPTPARLCDLEEMEVAK